MFFFFWGGGVGVPAFFFLKFKKKKKKMLGGIFYFLGRGLVYLSPFESLFNFFWGGGGVIFLMGGEGVLLPKRKQLKTITGPVGIFPEEKSPIVSVCGY